MYVNEIMTDRVQKIEPEATLTQAAQRMDDSNIGILPVCREDQLIGIVTDRDIIIRAISAGLDPKTTAVSDAMTAPVVFCFEDQSIEQAVSIMKRKQLRRIPVLDRNHSLVGLLSIDDLVVDLPDKSIALDLLQTISAPLKAAS